MTLPLLLLLLVGGNGWAYEIPLISTPTWCCVPYEPQGVKCHGDRICEDFKALINRLQEEHVEQQIQIMNLNIDLKNANNPPQKKVEKPPCKRCKCGEVHPLVKDCAK